MQSSSSPIDTARDTLVNQLTSLKSLLRLNADGIGDDNDLFVQLSETRSALDRFEASLSRTRDIGVLTPEDFPSSRPTSIISSPSTNTTSPRLSLESLLSWQSSPTSHLSISPRDSLTKLDGCQDVVEEEEDGEEEEERGENEEGREEVAILEEEEEEEEEDRAFLRLSVLLAGLQAQAEAAVSSPTTLLRPQDLASHSRKGSEDFNSTKRLFKSTPTTPHLTPSTPTFHRTQTHSLLFGSPRKVARQSYDGEVDSFNNIGFPPLPPTPPPSFHKRHPSAPQDLRYASISRTASPGLSPIRTTTIPLSRQGSFLSKEFDLETLIGDIIEWKNREEEIVFRWAWMWLIGGGMIWLAVGWVLRWGCDGNCKIAAVPSAG